MTNVVPVTGQNEPTAKPVFDYALVVEMMGDEALFQEVAAMFVASVPTSIEELEAAFAAADWPVVRRAAHTLKGLFATFVAGEGEAAAKQLELAAGADGAARIACGVLVHGVREHALALRDALVGHLAGAPKPR